MACCSRFIFIVCWSILIFIAIVLGFVALVSPQWLIVPDNVVTVLQSQSVEYESMGLWQRCFTNTIESACNAYGDFSDIPSPWWQSTLILLGCSLFFVFVSWVISWFSFCWNWILIWLTRIFLLISFGLSLAACICFAAGLSAFATSSPVICDSADEFDTGECDLGYSSIIAFIYCVLLLLVFILSLFIKPRAYWLYKDEEKKQKAIKKMTQSTSKQSSDSSEQSNKNQSSTKVKKKKKRPKMKNFQGQTDLEITGWTEEDDELHIFEDAISDTVGATTIRQADETIRSRPLPTPPIDDQHHPYPQLPHQFSHYHPPHQHRYDHSNLPTAEDSSYHQRHFNTRPNSSDRASGDLWWDGFPAPKHQTLRLSSQETPYKSVPIHQKHHQMRSSPLRSPPLHVKGMKVHSPPSLPRRGPNTGLTALPLNRIKSNRREKIYNEADMKTPPLPPKTYQPDPLLGFNT